jgi:hypothetical protein
VWWLFFFFVSFFRFPAETKKKATHRLPNFSTLPLPSKASATIPPIKQPHLTIKHTCVDTYEKKKKEIMQ